MQCACTILSSVACPFLQYFSTLSHKRHNFQNNLLSIKCVFWFSIQLPSEIFLVPRTNEGGMTTRVHRSSCKVLFFYQIFTKIDFFDRLPKNARISIFMKICPVGVVVFHADGRTGRERWTGMTKLIVAFRNFANTPKKWTRLSHLLIHMKDLRHDAVQFGTLARVSARRM